MVVTVANTLSGISETAHGLDGGALDLAGSADQLAKRTEIQAASLEETLEEAIQQRPIAAVGLAIGLGFLIGVTWRR